MFEAHKGIWCNGAAAILIGSLAIGAAAQKTEGAAAGSGYLEVRQHEYTPQGCSHNGNTILCSFQLVNRGNAGPVNAWPGDLRIIQLVDTSHVPHAANHAYFSDAAGNHQAQLVLQPGDQGTITLEFPNVGSDVTAVEFHLQSQIVAAGTASAAAPAASATSAGSSTATAAAPATGTSPPAAGAAKPATSNVTPAAAPAAKPSAKPAATPGVAAATTAVTQSAACALNAKTPVCRAEVQRVQICARNPLSKACQNATAYAERLEATAH